MEFRTMSDERVKMLAQALEGIDFEMWKAVKLMVDWQFTKRQRQITLPGADDLESAMAGEITSRGVQL